MNIDYQAEVKKVRNKANCVRAEYGYVILNAFNRALSYEKETPLLAWQSAYENLKKQNKL
jgi:hypothetical protein